MTMKVLKLIFEAIMTLGIVACCKVLIAITNIDHDKEGVDYKC